MVKRRNKGEIKMTEREKMELGMWYDANNDEELLKQRVLVKICVLI